MNTQLSTQEVPASRAKIHQRSGFGALLRANAWPLIVIVLLVGMLVVRAMPAGPAQGLSTTPLKKRLVLHSVDCGSQGGEICPEARPVLDEAMRILKGDDNPVTIRIAAVDSVPGGEGHEIAPVTAATVLDYLAAAGVEAGRIAVE
jgi:hypothetical protein